METWTSLSRWIINLLLVPISNNTLGLLSLRLVEPVLLLPGYLSLMQLSKITQLWELIQARLAMSSGTSWQLKLNFTMKLLMIHLSPLRFIFTQVLALGLLSVDSVLFLCLLLEPLMCFLTVTRSHTNRSLRTGNSFNGLIASLADVILLSTQLLLQMLTFLLFSDLVAALLPN